MPRKLFVVSAAIAFGVTVALAVVIGVCAWWMSRPKPRDRTAILANYERPFLSDSDKDDRLLEFRYALRNTTSHDIAFKGEHATLFTQRNDATLINVSDLFQLKLDDVTVPAGETVVYILHPKLGYKPKDDCKVQPASNPNKEQIGDYIGACYGWMKGFVIMSDEANVRIDMPFNPQGRSPK